MRDYTSLNVPIVAINMIYFNSLETLVGKNDNKKLVGRNINNFMESMVVGRDYGISSVGYIRTFGVQNDSRITWHVVGYRLVETHF